MQVEKGDVAGLVAQANSLNSKEEVTATEVPVKLTATGEVDTAQMKRDSNEVLLQKLEGAQYDERGNLKATEEVVVDTTPEVDVSKMTNKEKIAYYQELEDASNGVQHNPLAEVDASLEKAGFDKGKMRDFELEYIEKGELTPDTLKALTDAGFPKEAIDAYITTKLQLVQNSATATMNEVCGSVENFTQMAEWMRSSLSPNEIAQYDKNVQGEHAKVYLESMYGKYQKANPVEVTPRVLRSGNSAVPAPVASDTYSNQHEMVKAMADPRYGKEPNYTQAVRSKVLRMK